MDMTLLTTVLLSAAGLFVGLRLPWRMSVIVALAYVAGLLAGYLKFAPGACGL